MMVQDGKVKMSIRAKTKKVSKDKEKPAVKVRVEDLRIGDLIAITLREHSLYGVVAVHTRKIESIDLCEGKWRTHVHINKTDCYDTRSFVHVAV